MKTRFSLVRARALFFSQRQICLISAVALACFLFFAPIANAQATGQGAIFGIVTDPTGAVVTGAHLRITSVQTGVFQNSTTNSTGYYEVDNLNPATYRISVESPGFHILVRDGITVQTGSHVSVPLQLHAGSTTETITVNSDATLLNTDSGSSGQVLTTLQVESIPVSGNSPTWLALIAPGVQGNLSQSASTDDTLGYTGITQNFGTFGNIGVNEFSLDGAPNQSNAHQSGLNLTIDELGEMKLDVTGYDASVGHTMGVMTTQTTKTGTNDFHGSVRETYTDRHWAAMNHFQGLNYPYQAKLNGCVNGASTNLQCLGVQRAYGLPGLHMNNGSATLGGPVYIPKVFNGRNKLFFFASVLDDVYAGASSRTATIPTVQERSGDFRDLPVQTTNIPAAFVAACGASTPYYGQYQIYDPLSVTLDSHGTPRRAPFCGNVLPSSRLASSPMVTVFNQAMPIPTQNNPTGGNYTYTQITPQTYRDYTGRVDYKVTSRDSIFVRYTRGNYTKGLNDYTVGNLGSQQGPRWVDAPAIGWDHIFNDFTNLDITFGGTNYKTAANYYPNYDKYKPSDLGLPAYLDQYAALTNKSLLEMPVLNLTNYTNTEPNAVASSLGHIDSVPTTYRSFALRGNLVHVQGRHTMSAGAEYRLQNASSGVNGNLSGSYNFDNSFTQQNNGSDNTYQQSNTGLSYASLLMGINTTASVGQNPSMSLQSPYYALYGEDTWRVTPKLTVVPGLRFEYEYGVTEKHNQLIVGWDPNADLSAISAPANAAYQSALAGATSAQRAILPSSLVIQGGPMYAGVNGAPRNEWNDSHRFLPRVAVAYQANSHVVIRAGYGLFFDTLNALSPSIDQGGFSATTSSNSSNSFGTNFVAGISPLADPFPANANGSRFNTPIGSAAGQMYYLGSGPTETDHGLLPARVQRGSVGVQYEFAKNTLLDVSWNYSQTTDLQVIKNDTFTPSSLYAGGQQPNTQPSTVLASKIANPFAIANFAGLATSNPAAYGLLTHNNVFTSSTIALSQLVHAYPQMQGLSRKVSQGESHFQEVLINLTRRYSHGLTLTGSMQLNNQHDRDYFANAFDAAPSWEPSNNSEPIRFTFEWVYKLPFGRGAMWATSGWKSAVFGGYQLSGGYEAQLGQLVNFGNIFYVGDVTANAIKIKHPVYVNNQATGGTNYVQWLNPGTATAIPTNVTNSDGSTTTTCAYSGTGFVTNSACQPTSRNLRVFPTRVNGVRQMGMNDADASIQRTFSIFEALKLEATMNAYNVFNHQTLGAPSTNPTSTSFGQITSDGYPGSSGRWLSIQGRLRF